MNSKVYKWCAVAQCTNTSIKTPSKLFVYVPNKKIIRNKWLNFARRDPTAISLNSPIYFCEDHFDLPNDMENYMQYHVMGSVSQVRMKPGCVPTRYNCQADRRKRTSNTTEPPYVLRKKRLMVVEESQKDLEEKSGVTKHLETGEISSSSSAIKEESTARVSSTENPTVVSYPVRVKQELPVEFEPLCVKNEDPGTSCPNNAIEANNPEHITNRVIKQEPQELADEEAMKGVQSWEVTLQQIPTYTHTDIKREPEDVDQTDPDDVTTQLHPEEIEQQKIKDIKFVNQKDYLHIGETKISKQDRARPGPSSEGGGRCQTNIPKNTETTPPAGIKLFECDICGYKCKRRINLKRHMRTHTGEKPYKCGICDFRFRQSGSLKRHMGKHTGERPYRCEICDYKCREPFCLKQHMRTHKEDKPYKCESCDYQCKQIGNLRTHVRRHTGEKPFKCPSCDYKCRAQSSLNRHMRSHTGDKPYKCEVCGFKCNAHGGLKAHMRMHTGEKPYKCKICNYRCSRSGNLSTHMGMHTGEKPYKCELCDYKSRSRGNLMTHKRMHAGDKPYKCEICDYSSGQLGGLKRHQRMHSGEKPFECKVCDYKCNEKGNLKRHMKTHTE